MRISRKDWRDITVTVDYLKSEVNSLKLKNAIEEMRDSCKRAGYKLFIDVPMGTLDGCCFNGNYEIIYINNKNFTKVKRFFSNGDRVNDYRQDMSDNNISALAWRELIDKSKGAK